MDNFMFLLILAGVIILVVWSLRKPSRGNKKEPTEESKPEILGQASTSTANIPKCPTCGSTAVEKISGANKVGAVVLFGVFSLGHLSKTFKCQNCNYKW